MRGISQRKHKTEVRRRETDHDESDIDVEMSESNKSPSLDKKFTLQNSPEPKVEHQD